MLIDHIGSRFCLSCQRISGAARRHRKEQVGYVGAC